MAATARRRRRPIIRGVSMAAARLGQYPEVSIGLSVTHRRRLGTRPRRDETVALGRHAPVRVADLTDVGPGNRLDTPDRLPWCRGPINLVEGFIYMDRIGWPW